MTPELWFSVTSWEQFAVLLPIGVGVGYWVWGGVSYPGTGRRAIAYAEMVFVFWAFLLAVRAFGGRVPWQASIGTFLLNILFVLAMYLGRRLRER